MPNHTLRCGCKQQIYENIPSGTMLHVYFRILKLNIQLPRVCNYITNGFGIFRQACIEIKYIAMSTLI